MHAFWCKTLEQTRQTDASRNGQNVYPDSNRRRWRFFLKIMDGGMDTHVDEYTYERTDEPSSKDAREHWKDLAVQMRKIWALTYPDSPTST